MRASRRCALVCTALLLAWPAAADDEDEEKEELTRHWSVTLLGAGTAIESQEADDSVTGFFDQYEYTPNKSSTFPVELGVRDATFDLFSADETPVLQVRYWSPTSNLGVSGEDIDEPFWNQHALAHGQFDSLHFDLFYDRQRTEQLRRFPNTSLGALVPQDLTGAGDRFARERTSVGGELRFHPQQVARELDLQSAELALRGGYEARQGQRQIDFLLSPTNDWVLLSRNRDQDVATVGGGLLVDLQRRFTLALDFDHERFRQRASPLLQSELGAPFPASNRTIGFVPDTDRSTGSVRLRGHPVDRLGLEAGFQISNLEQVEDFTPLQRSAGLDDNRVRSYSARVAADLRLVGRLSGNTYFKWDRRENDIERGTALFSAAGGSQVAPFLSERDRFRAGAELLYRFDLGNRVAVGWRLDAVDRELEFADAGSSRILPENALVADESLSHTVYGRAHLRPLRGLRGVAELGYRETPETGYTTELDDAVYGKLRVSYLLPIERSVQLSGFASGSSGVNRDFDLVGGLGPDPAGPRLERDLERWEYLLGLTLTASPWRDLGLHAAFFLSRNALDQDLALSTAQRTVQDFLPLGFVSPDALQYRFDQRSFTLGAHHPLGEKTDVSLSYAFTRAFARYAGSAVSPEIQAIDGATEVDSDTHGMDLEIGHWLQDGLRLELGYRLQLYEDREDAVQSAGSVATPFDRSDLRHRVHVAVTLTDAWFSARD